MFKKFFGSSKTEEKTSVSETMQQMEKIDETIECMEKRIALVEKSIDTEVEKAKNFMQRKNKIAALQCMKRKKMLEDTLTAFQGKLLNLETSKRCLQEAAINSQVQAAQKAAVTQLSKINKTMNADTVADEREKLQELVDEQKTVSEALAEPIDVNAPDDDELLDDLNELMAADPVPSQATTTTVAPTMSKADQELLNGVTVPGEKLPSTTVHMSEVEELRRLEAELNS